MRTVQPDIVVHVRRGSDTGGDGPQRGADHRRSRWALPSNVIGSPVGCGMSRARCWGIFMQSDRVVIRALPSSRNVSSARLEQQLRTGLRRALQSVGNATGERGGAGAARFTPGRGRGAGCGLPDPAIPAHGVAPATGDVPLRSDLQPVRGRRSDRIRLDPGRLAGGRQARQVRPMASGWMGSDTGGRADDFQDAAAPGSSRRR